MSFELWAVLLAMTAAGFWVFEIIQYILVVKKDWTTSTPKYLQLKKGVLGFLVNGIFGIINLFKLLFYSILCLVELGHGVVKSPGFVIDIVATIGFTAMFSGAGASILGTVVGLAISNIFSLGILIWGMVSRGHSTEVALA